MINLIKLFATGMGVGYIPIAPGTFGTVLGALIYWYLIPDKGSVFFLFIVVVLFLGVWASSKAEKLFNNKDDKKIVIDEIAGFWISVIFLPKRPDVLFAAFVFFRFFDIYKPLLINKSQNLRNGWGIMADDFLAGVFTNILIHGFLFYMRVVKW